MTVPAKPPMRILRPLRSRRRLDLLAEPAAHLAAGVAAGKRVNVELLVELVHQLHAAALIHPGVLHARVEAERHRGAEREGRILAEVVVGRGVAHLDGAVLHRIGGCERRHDFAGGENLDLEFVVGRFGDRLGEHFRRAVDRVERLREARGQPPFQFRRRLRDRRRGDRGGGEPTPAAFEELTTFHVTPPDVRVRVRIQLPDGRS